jgi:hypothetical protein
MAFDLNAYLLDPANLRDECREYAKRKDLLEKLKQVFGVSRQAEMTTVGHLFRQVRPITCASGLTLSAQASVTHYCEPRDSVGPWTAVEIGFPSERVEEFMDYAENPETPTDSVYGWVPVEVVEAVVNSHGGIVAACPVDSTL